MAIEPGIPRCARDDGYTLVYERVAVTSSSTRRDFSSWPRKWRPARRAMGSRRVSPDLLTCWLRPSWPGSRTSSPRTPVSAVKTLASSGHSGGALPAAPRPPLPTPTSQQVRTDPVWRVELPDLLWRCRSLRRRTPQAALDETRIEQELRLSPRTTLARPDVNPRIRSISQLASVIGAVEAVFQI